MVWFQYQKVRLRVMPLEARNSMSFVSIPEGAIKGWQVQGGFGCFGPFQYQKVRLRVFFVDAERVAVVVSIPEGAIKGGPLPVLVLLDLGFNTRRCD